jgi:DNA polymerase
MLAASLEEEKVKRFELMKTIHDELVALKCPLADERRANKVFPVIGEGSHMAKIMFIGEAPGKNEAATGKPFCGASGKFLSELLTSIGIMREDVYITNIVKDRPTDNRDPSLEEIAQYGPFLDKQIEIIQPKAIVTLGRFSMQYIMNKLGLELELGPISKIHGKVFYVRKTAVIPLYHPAAALYNGGMRGTLAEDFKVIKGVI